MDMNLVVPNQSVVSGLSQTTGQQPRLGFDIAQPLHDQIQQFISIRHARIADLSFRLRPDVFFRVEFRRVSRKPFQMQPPMVAAKFNDFSVPMYRAAVQ